MTDFEEYRSNFFKFADDLLVQNKIKVFDFGDFHKEMIHIALSNRYTAFMLPVGHLKTTLLSICYPIWRMYTRTGYEMCLVSSTLSQSVKILSQVQNLIENTPWLKKALVPDNRSDSWSKTQLTTKNGNILYVRPFNPSSRGIQPNEIIYDDILRESDVSMDQIKDIFWRIFYPRGQVKNCKHVIVGTPMSDDDLLFEIKKKAEDEGLWTFMTYPAVISDEKGNQKALWPDGFPMHKLNEIKRDMGQYRFSQEYMCKPATAGEGFYRQDLVLNSSDDDFGFTYNTQGSVYIGADFAMSEAPTGDYNVFTVVDCIPGEVTRRVRIEGKYASIKIKNPVIIKHIERYKGSVGQVRRIKALVDLYHPLKVITDVSTFGHRFTQELREQGVSVDGQDFHRANRNHLLVNLRRLIETEDFVGSPPRLIIPTSEKDGTFNTTKQLLRELSGFIETTTQSKEMKTIASVLDHDDTVMSLALAVKDVASARPTMENVFFGV